jgi:hypothetical protein
MTRDAKLSRLQWAILIVAVLGIALSIAGALVDVPGLLRAYLVAMVTWMAFPLGCMALLVTWHLTGGRWGLVIGDSLEAAMQTLPLLAILFLPILLDLHAIYPWARPEVLAENETVARKAAFLNPSFFILCALIYLAIWTGLTFVLTGPGGSFATHTRRRGLATVGAILYALTASFASIDWVLSLQPSFHSAVFGMLVMSGQAIGGYAFAILVGLGLVEAAGRAELVREHRLIGLGSLFLALVLLWAYFAFIQYLVIWSGNLPAGAAWYLGRAEGIWLALTWIVALGNAGLPFVVLLAARARQSWRVLMALAAIVVVSRILESLWLTLPAFGDDAPPAWLVAGTLAAVGGVWISAVLWLVLPRTASIVRAVEKVGHG